MGRAPCCDKANVKKGPWSPEEDSKLKAYIEQNGTGGNWIALPQKVGLKRCGKSCRLRWLNYLRPNIKHGGFSEEEDKIICSLYISIGSRWSIIAAQLPGRTDNDIKNYWNTRLKKKLLGKRKDQQNRRLAAAAAAAAKQAELKNVKRYEDSEANRNVYGTHPTAGVDGHMNMYTNGPYASFGTGMIPQLFEQTTCSEGSTIADTNPSTQPARFQFNPQQAFDQEMFVPDRNSSFRKLIERLEATLLDRSDNMNMITTSQMQASNCINNVSYASQMPQSTLETTGRVSYETTPASSLEYARCMENQVKLENPSVLGPALPQNDNPLVFPTSSMTSESPEGNYQSVWMNMFNAESNSNVNLGGYEFSMDLTDLLYCINSNSSSILEERGGNYGCGPSLGTMDISGWAAHMKSSRSSSPSIYPYDLQPENGLQQGIFQEEAMFEL